MEDVSMAQAVPVGVYDNAVPDQFGPKDSPLLRVPMFTQQGELRPEVRVHMTPSQMQNEITNMQDQITVLQHQLNNQPQNYPLSPQLPNSPQYPHMVPRGYSHFQNQQVPLSPQHPQINFAGSPAQNTGYHPPNSSLHRNVVQQQLRAQHLAPPQQHYLTPQFQSTTHNSSSNNNNNNNNNSILLDNPPQFQLDQHQAQQQLHQLQQDHQRQLQQHAQQHGHLMGEDTIRRDAMMAYLMDSLNQGKDIGHYGSLVFAMVAHHFMSETGVISYLRKNPNMSESQAKNLYGQVQSRDYNPPRRDKILEWQTHQQFPIIPNTSNHDFGNVYKDLTFPSHVYQHIAEYYK